VTRALCALLVAIATCGVSSGSLAAERSVLWTVRGQHNTVYLFGSIHVLRPSDVGLPRAAEAAYADAEQLVMEIDLDDPAVAEPTALAMQMQRQALLPDGQSLKTVLGDDYAAVAEHAAAAGLDLSVLDGFAPWFVGVMLLQLEMTSRGFDAAHGIEQQVAERAVADGKPILGLETPSEQFAVLAGLSRKSSLGAITGRAPGDRLAASLAAALAAVARGASIVRVHDVRETVDALNVWRAVEGAG